MPVDWEATLASLVLTVAPVVAGVVVGFLLTPLSDRWSNRRTRRRLATVLGSEVESIRAMAIQSIEVNGPAVARADEALERLSDPKATEMDFSAVETDDADYPTKAFDSHLAQVDLFDVPLAATLMDLYRWVEFAHHMKRLNLKFGAQFDELSRPTMARGGVTGPEKDRLTVAVAFTVNYAKMYLRIQERVRSLATSAGDALSELSGRSLRDMVSVSVGEVLSGTYPKRYETPSAPGPTGRGPPSP
jgi:hypothetical protein